MENRKGRGKSWKMMIMSRNFYYCTEQFCKSDTTSFMKSIYEPFYLFNNVISSVLTYLLTYLLKFAHR